MKTKFGMALIVLSSIFLIACDADDQKTDGQLPVDGQASLKVSFNAGVVTLADAVKEITNSPEFLLLGSVAPVLNQDGPLKAADLRNDSMQILLSDIAGVYEYSWKRVKKGGILRFFERTADNDNLIVRLPVEKIKNYHYLFIYAPKDSTLKNNFEAVVSDYYQSRHYLRGLEYRIATALKVDSNSVGNVATSKTRNKVNGYNYLSTYTLANGYTVMNKENSGDTAVSVYSISKEDKVLFEENITSYKVAGQFKHREKVYALTIGDVKIIRNAGPNSLDSAKVYLGGVLQTSAKVEVVVYEPDSTNLGVAQQKRDIKITFDDGTSTTIRELKAGTIEDMALIFKAVRQAGFATEIVDRIAANIYWQKK